MSGGQCDENDMGEDTIFSVVIEKLKF